MDAWKRVGLKVFLLLVLMMPTPVLAISSASPFVTTSSLATVTVAGSLSSPPPISSTTSAVSQAPTGTPKALNATESPQKTAEIPTASPLDTAFVSITVTASRSISTSPTRPSATLAISQAPKKTPKAMVTPATSTGSVAVTSMHQSPSPSSSFNLPPSKSSFIPTGTLTPPQIKYPMIVAVTFKMTWGDLCPLLTLFKERLSQHLLEYKGYKNTEYYNVATDRIILINRDKNCNDKSFYNEEAVIEFYITDNSKVDSVSMANKTNIPITIKAFKILYDYWVNHLMVRLHEVFRKQITKVELIEGGKDVTEKYQTEMTGGKRLGIGIGVCLAVILFLGIVYFCWTARRQVKNAGHTLNNKQMVFTNEVAYKEEAKGGSTETVSSEPKATQPVADSQGDDEPEEVVVHQRPQTLEKTPLLTDNQDGQRAFGAPSHEKPLEAPLAHPEPVNDFQEEPDEPTVEPKEEPIVSPGEPSAVPIKSFDKPEAEPIKSSDEGIEEQSKSPVAPEVTETESPPVESPPEPAKEEDDKPASGGDDEEIKPDFGQSDHKDEDPTQGAINLAFEARDEAPGHGKEKDEETKF